MKITRHGAPSLWRLAAIIAICSAAPAVVGQTAAKYDGSYRGSFNGTFASRPAMGHVAFSVANGVITVTDPGEGKGTVDSSGSANFSGSLGVADIACNFTGTFQASSGAKQGTNASGSWTCSGSGQTGKGTWTGDRQ